MYSNSLSLLFVIQLSSLCLLFFLSNQIQIIDCRYSSQRVIHHYHPRHSSSSSLDTDKYRRRLSLKRTTSHSITSSFVWHSIQKRIVINHNNNNWKKEREFRFVSRTSNSISIRNMVQQQQLKDFTKDTFKDKIILVTGASGGLGSSFVQTLCECNPSVIILSARKEATLNDVVKTCQQINNKVKYDIILCDLEDPISVQKLISNILIKYINGIDVLINNGGVSSRSKFVDTTLEIDQRIMQINFFAGVALAKAFIPKMIDKKNNNNNNNKDNITNGRIIWISSVQGLVALPYRTSYASSKFAVQGYCEALRAELYTSNIYIHCISPGYIRTNLSKSALTGDGTPSGVMDSTTATGADPIDVTIEILNKVSIGYTDFTVAANFQAIAAIYLRLLCPALLRNSLVKRFIKQEEKEKLILKSSDNKKKDN